ncbi:hypothetical protein [Planococcus koreensis]|uniref:hypothetical protein n=1 Tax=Planococcus koreensis TaxID=112331 RepID=UPI0039FD2B4D
MLVAMTYLLVQDYFPQLTGLASGKWIAVAVIAVLFLSADLRLKKAKMKNRRQYGCSAPLFIC